MTVPQWWDWDDGRKGCYMLLRPSEAPDSLGGGKKGRLIVLTSERSERPSAADFRVSPVLARRTNVLAVFSCKEREGEAPGWPGGATQVPVIDRGKP